MPLLDLVSTLVALTVLGILAIISYKVRIVTKSGLITAFLLGLVVWLLASWTWFLLMLVFFVVTAQFTHYKYSMKRRHGVAQEKGGARDWSHVLANGGLPLTIVIISFVLVSFFGRSNAYGSMDVGWGLNSIPAYTVTGIVFAAFLGALATATADTLATEIGLLNPSPPRLITNPRKVVPPGTSGGISVAGELATLMGTLMIGGVAAILGAPFWITIFGTTLMPELGGFAPITMVVVALIGGFSGCTIDSLLGATVQGLWHCNICHKITEKRAHCGKPAQYLRGNRFLDNHMVNITSSLIGALIAALLYIFLLTAGFA